MLNSGAPTDNAKEIFDRYRDFEIRIVRHPWGVKLEMQNAPAAAFVDGQMIRGIKEHLFAVLRDVVFISNEIIESGRFDLTDSASITNAVFHVLRNARAARLQGAAEPGGVLGRALDRRRRVPVHQERRLRTRPARPGRVHRLRPGGHEGPDEGRHHRPRQAAHRARAATSASPSPGSSPPSPRTRSSTQLAILPDIEKRLEAFVRLAHGIVVFPGGAGTAEEILYLTGILLDPANREQPFPIVLTGPRESAAYFEHIAQLHRRHARGGGDAAPHRHRR